MGLLGAFIARVVKDCLWREVYFSLQQKAVGFLLQTCKNIMLSTYKGMPRQWHKY
jgi:hypothetical protein